ncbi:hypothetical protein B0T16DRAFT_407738 [Cercophora newfieldiana]|uniref:Secreted protein n=1 Tax=Cercophora newfieldiana TaxID=92897 RepID=A0AA40CR45_9PEZI|nr:hypothetical protein B0T16DRAFT_407738 [Cercophora newfieldiana]
MRKLFAFLPWLPYCSASQAVPRYMYHREDSRNTLHLDRCSRESNEPLPKLPISCTRLSNQNVWAVHCSRRWRRLACRGPKNGIHIRQCVSHGCFRWRYRPSGCCRGVRRRVRVKGVSPV